MNKLKENLLKYHFLMDLQNIFQTAILEGNLQAAIRVQELYAKCCGFLQSKHTKTIDTNNLKELINELDKQINALQDKELDA